MPFAELADAVGAADEARRLLARELGHRARRAPQGSPTLDVPVLLDGAQGVGAVAVDVAALGCAFYAGSGQKWLCGPIGSGMLWVAPDVARAPGAASAPTYLNLDDAGARARPPSCSPTPAATTRPACRAETLRRRAWPPTTSSPRTAGPRSTRARPRCAARLADAPGRRAAARSPRAATTTLVSWEDADPEATRDRLADAGVVVRNLPGTPYVRASVGAWNDEGDLERLLAAL